MSVLSILAGIIPLIVFVIVDMFASMRTALIFAIIFAFLEAIISFYMFGEVDQVTLFSFLIVLVMAGVSFLKESSIFFKFQPVILSFIFGSLLLGSYFFQDTPIFVSLITKYSDAMPEEIIKQISSPIYMKLLGLMTFYAGIALICHAIVTAWAALKLSNWWWVSIRAIGFYLFMFLGAMAANFHLRFFT